MAEKRNKFGDHTRVDHLKNEIQCNWISRQVFLTI